ncbi:hypothetical protein PsAD2_04027 [Pseudovibrio axinellae]|uniref:Uncharacterized protein n=1 Tax=Pseudovibrio axinellae TaxID=989403 RepID=A0A165U1D1_9HYPH|nr:hypothetical protein PsAD2_04027 [Pseudovibrio axinellae]SEQ65220.1 hypothetical protein SAMN05421798_103348 [Pseudovibrio axinellae]
MLCNIVTQLNYSLLPTVSIHKEGRALGIDQIGSLILLKAAQHDIALTSIRDHRIAPDFRYASTSLYKSPVAAFLAKIDILRLSSFPLGNHN